MDMMNLLFIACPVACQDWFSWGFSEQAIEEDVCHSVGTEVLDDQGQTITDQGIPSEDTSVE
jgi:hypothetical protein